MWKTRILPTSGSAGGLSELKHEKGLGQDLPGGITTKVTHPLASALSNRNQSCSETILDFPVGEARGLLVLASGKGKWVFEQFCVVLNDMPLLQVEVG